MEISEVNKEDLLRKLYENNEKYSNKNKKKKKHKKKTNKQLLMTNDSNNIKSSNHVDEIPYDSIEYVYSRPHIDMNDPNYEHFCKIFDKFQPDDPQFIEQSESKTNQAPKLSKRKLKQQMRISIADLKLRVQRPEVVEMHDANSKEAVMLIHLKSYRNTVPVPKHWSYKRKYLQGKRGFVKPPFDLPAHIKATGIMELRSAYHDRENARDLRTKMRNKIRPKLGKTDIDYQKLHDAFFKYQAKPRMSMHGDLYYEGKEFEVKLKQKKPGDISDDLRISLGMPVGVNKHLVPPPWLIAMQRYGPPPSYPNLKIPGLNAPIPEGATFGYHAGGWGKPPVDELGRPLYGDVFGTNLPPEETYNIDIDIDKSLWGQLEVEIETASQSDQEMEDITGVNDDINEPITALTTYSSTDTNIIPQTIIPDKVELESPEFLQLRKKKSDALYSIIPTNVPSNDSVLLPTSHTYDITNKTDISIQDEIQDVDMEVDVEPVKRVIKPKNEPVKSNKKDQSTKKNRDFKF